MTPVELKQCLTILSGMFSPRFNTGHRVLVEPELRPLAFDRAKAAILQLKSETAADAPFDAARLLALLKTAHVPTNASEAVEREGDWCEMRRRQNPQLAKAGDPEVILRVHRSFWFEAQKRNREHRRADIAATCARLLRSIGWEDKAAAEWAESIFADPDFFRLVLSQLRNDAAIFDHAGAAASRA